MPGDRLTHDERGQIASGLAAGLTYAEIARRMDRPKSTIIREVARNGGAHRYRADQAQQATRWRARRRAPGPPVHADPGVRTPEALRDFEREFAEMMAGTGVPPMMARVLACLFTSDTGSGTAVELVARLEVSPASVSKAVGWLEQRGLIARERDGRRQRYVIDDQFGYRAWQASLDSMTRWADLTRRGAGLVDGPAGARLADTSRFFRSLHQDMTEAAEHWRRSLG
ncbi:GbsR/MarR family transcriptional regulator [Amycolatopsis regifaucium]|uniref:MarR family transcriptional regulator n=1 Tax=Amycolatopsis regifaucium TaxID=546365 RepID=A0A154MRM7_9PSEU|nr:winged helix-turn-helix domain-containing protein [Amycolatopsis regifaucium]KZB86981.1 MarR family transcriptional regulator [Amycolatopsis regifaucium]OKA09410.1 MarR family transcriptional regulator [Amycolatopsis regifaucium]SFH60433.1 MarR family protein [Amycolatopsis regifaucium]